MASNIAPLADGRSTPYEARFKEPCSGKLIPFGQLVHYRPPPPVARKKLQTFSRKTTPGLMLGWHMQPGQVFHNEYDVVPLSAFQSAVTPKRIPIHTSKGGEIVVHDVTKFPLAEARDRKMYLVKAIDYDRPPLPAPSIEDKDEESEKFWSSLTDLPEESQATDLLYAPEPFVAPMPDPLEVDDPTGHLKGADGYTYTYIAGRKTRVVKTSRPPDILPEAWQAESYANRKKIATAYREEMAARAEREKTERAARSALASASGPGGSSFAAVSAATILATS